MTISTPIKNLKQHPAQMRTVHDIESMATLCLQIYERGLDEWQTLLASPNGQATPDGVATYFIVSGHRRRMARLLAWALADWATDHPDTEIGVEVVRTMVSTLVNSLGSLDKVIISLLEKYGEREIPIALFDGSEKAEILSLQAANYGSEQADTMGIAHSFCQAVEAGATPEEIGRNCGQSSHYVRNHLALSDIPPELAQRIAAGELPMSVARMVADLPEPKRAGLSIFILANEPGKLTAKSIKTCAATLKQWTGLQMPLMVKHQSQRNIARALVRLWSQVVETYPEDAYAAATMLIFRNVHEEPWSNQDKLTLWFQALGGDTYFGDSAHGGSQGGINWTAVVQHLITELSCESCPIAQLPQQHLRSDLSTGQGGPLGMPCRVGEMAHSASSTELSRSGQATGCIHGLTPSDPFDCRVPWDWSEHPDVVDDGGAYRVKSYEALHKAWQTQLALEQAEDEVTAVTADNEQTTQPTKDKQSLPTKSQQPEETSEPPAPAKESPIAKQRAKIADFMKRHEQMSVSHPFATPCGRCRHRLDKSPTKNDAVPHCAWAGRSRRVEFKMLQPADKESSHLNIPVCRQFAPNQPWNDLIPAHAEPPGLPREWLKTQILYLVDASNNSYNSNAFEFLTGRPMGSNKSYGDWFSKQLVEQGGDLSDAQLFTLFTWAHAEWQRSKSNPFSLPVNSNGIQFITCQEQPLRLATPVAAQGKQWQSKEAA